MLLGMQLIVPGQHLYAMQGESSAIVNQEELTEQLVQACEKGRKDEVERLLAMPGIDVNYEDRGDCMTPLLYSTSCGYTEIVRMLLVMPGIDVNKKACRDCYTPLHAASEHGHTEIVRMLLAHGADQSIINSIWASNWVSNVDNLQALVEARTVWKHREKFCDINETGDIQLIDDAELSIALSQLSKEDQQAITNFHANTDTNIVQTIKSVATKYLNILNDPASKAFLENWHKRDFSQNSDIKTIKTLLARKDRGLLNGSIKKLTFDTLFYIGSFLAPAEKPALDPLLNRRSRAIREKVYRENDPSLIEADHADAMLRLEQKCHHE